MEKLAPKYEISNMEITIFLVNLLLVLVYSPSGPLYGSMRALFYSNREKPSWGIKP